MTKFRVGALVAAGVLAGGLATSASAADLGGNCCADLEERIAELEATTARKGNRKVSLTISGWVGQQVMWWDDGRESNVYVTDLGSTIASHVKFTGQATILPGWYAGYVLQLEAIGSDSLTTNQFVPDGPNALLVPATINGVSTLQSFWFVKSDQLGKVSIGKQSDAADNSAILVDGSGSLIPANWVAFDVNSFFIREKGGDLTPLHWGGNYCQTFGGAWGDCDGVRATSSATTRRPLVASQFRPRGVRTTSGPSRPAMLANGTASRLQPSPLTRKAPTSSAATMRAALPS